MLILADSPQAVSTMYDDTGAPMAALVVSANDLQTLQAYRQGYAGPYAIDVSSGSVNGQPSNQVFIGKPTWPYRNPVLLGLVMLAAGVAGGLGISGLLRR